MIVWSSSLLVGDRIFIYREGGSEVMIDIKKNDYVSELSLTLEETEFVKTNFLTTKK